MTTEETIMHYADVNYDAACRESISKKKDHGVTANHKLVSCKRCRKTSDWRGAHHQWCVVTGRETECKGAE